MYILFFSVSLSLFIYMFFNIAIYSVYVYTLEGSLQWITPRIATRTTPDSPSYRPAGLRPGTGFPGLAVVLELSCNGITASNKKLRLV